MPHVSGVEYKFVINVTDKHINRAPIRLNEYPSGVAKAEAIQIFHFLHYVQELIGKTTAEPPVVKAISFKSLIFDNNFK